MTSRYRVAARVTAQALGLLGCMGGMGGAQAVTADTTPPALALASVGPVMNGTVSLAGTATDDRQVARVTWVNDRGGSGTASLNAVGTPASWSTAPVALQSGVNTLTLTAVDGAGNATVLKKAVTHPGTGRVLSAGPGNYLSVIPTLKPGDTLVLAAGDYGRNADGSDTASVPGLPLFGLNGTATAPITITGPETGARPLLWGRATHNTVRLSDASFVVVRNLDIDGRDLGGAGVAAQGATHDITVENLRIRGVGGFQQNVGIRVNATPTWNWVIRHNEIVGAGTGMYLGNSDGKAPFVAGLVERNVVRDTIGYNVQVKHQVAWTTVPAGMPTGRTVTVIRNNVFSKLSSFVSADGARPNLLVGAQPPSGPGALNAFEIHGNFFWQNPTEALFQGEGNVALWGNVMVNDAGTAVRFQQNNGPVREVRIFGNTVLARDGGISISGAAAGTTQRVTGNAVYAATPLRLGSTTATASANATGLRAAATAALVQPNGALGSFNPYPLAGMLQGAVPDTTGLSAYAGWDRDFSGAVRGWSRYGAYVGSGSGPGWLPQLGFKP